jgi:pyrroloquinoline quinone (PQQ) biosynthesis protein C
MYNPVLQLGATVYSKNNFIIIEMDDSETTINGLNNALKIVDFILDMDGNNDLESLCKKYNISLELGKKITQKLSDSKIISFLLDKKIKTIDAIKFSQKSRMIFKTWKKQLFTNSFWEKLSSGTASINEFTGWILENYYFIEGATLRLSLVTAEASYNKKIQKYFSKHFIEEYNHHHFFMKALMKLGLTSEQVHQHRPLPSTLSIINHMRDCARRDVLAYSMCSAFLESTAEDRSIVDKFFDVLNTHYDPTNLGIITPLINHAKLDEEYNHNDWLEKICHELPPLNIERASAALQSGKMLLEILQRWSSEIENYYSNRNAESLINPYSYP